MRKMVLFDFFICSFTNFVLLLFYLYNQTFLRNPCCMSDSFLPSSSRSWCTMHNNHSTACNMVGIVLVLTRSGVRFIFTIPPCVSRQGLYWIQQGLMYDVQQHSTIYIYNMERIILDLTRSGVRCITITPPYVTWQVLYWI